jgi:N-methylhydantoinase A/oxoprolinase/acetone carboxylase beta subunit
MSTLAAEEMVQRFEELEELARAQLRDDGISEDRWVIQRVADCRYLGQGYELRVDVPSGAIDEAWKEKVTADFHDAHEREYSRRFEGSDLEIPNVRVRGVGLMPALAMPEIERSETVPADALTSERPAWFRVDGELRELPTRFYTRDALRAGNRIDGPAVINQYDSTTVIPPGLVAEVDPFGNIVIWIDESQRSQMMGAAGVAVG